MSNRVKVPLSPRIVTRHSISISPNYPTTTSSSPRFLGSRKKLNHKILAPMKTSKLRESNRYAESIRLLIKDLNNYDPNYEEFENPLICSSPILQSLTSTTATTQKISEKQQKAKIEIEHREKAISLLNNFYEELSNLKDTNITKDNVGNCKQLTDTIFCFFGLCNSEIKTNNEPMSKVYNEIERMLRKIVHRLFNISQPTMEEVELKEEVGSLSKQKESLTERCNNLKELIKNEEDIISSREQEIKDLEERIFKMKSEVENANFKILDMVEIARAQRMTIAEKNAHINAISRESKEKQQMLIGDTPKDILRLWDKIISFINLVSSGSLNNIDKDKIFPKDPINSPPEVSSFFIQRIRERDTEEYMHFTEFFKEMRSTFTGDFYKPLEDQITFFWRNASDSYCHNFVRYKEMEMRIMGDTQKQLDTLRRTIPDQNKWMIYIIQNKIKIRLPKKVKAPDIMMLIDEAMKVAAKGIKEKDKYYVTDSLYEVLSKYESNIMLYVLANFTKQSTANPSVRLFKDFVVRNIPFHAFIFYVYLYKRRSSLSKEAEKIRLMKHFFDNYGIESLLREDESHIKVNEFSYMIGMLSLYLRTIEEIQKQYEKITNIHEMIEELTGDEEEQLKIYNFISFLSFGKETVEAYAVAVFWKRKSLPTALDGFTLEGSNFYPNYLK